MSAFQGLNVLAIGASRNTGYYAAIRLLDEGADITFLLRSPTIFDNNEVIKKYSDKGKVHLVKGDALVRADVQAAWDQAARDKIVDLCLFTLGGVPAFSITKGFIINPPNLVTQCFLNTVSCMPVSCGTHTKFIACSTLGLTKASHDMLPLVYKPLYSTLLKLAHEDKSGMEEIIAHCAGWKWSKYVDGGDKILPSTWDQTEGLPPVGSLKNMVVLRPAIFTDGECKADSKGSAAYRAAESDAVSGYTISRKDVAHFIVEGVLKQWDSWRDKKIDIAY